MGSSAVRRQRRHHSAIVRVEATACSRLIVDQIIHALVIWVGTPRLILAGGVVGVSVVFDNQKSPHVGESGPWGSFVTFSRVHAVICSNDGLRFVLGRFSRMVDGAPYHRCLGNLPLLFC